jgi:SAM-dependent methyltransferase
MSTITPVGAADLHVHRLYGEYAGLPVGVVTQCAQHADALQQLTWQACPGADRAAKACAYHEGHEADVFAQLHRTSSRAQRRHEHERSGLAGWLAESGDAALDFGGGLGLSSSLLREAGKRVTYVDVDGPAAAFARWYFARSGQPDIELLTTPSDRVVLPAGRQWDLVLVERVLECVPDPAAVVERLAGALARGGVLYLVLESALTVTGPSARPVAVDDLLARAPALRRLQHVLCGQDGRHAFRAG